MKGLRWMVPLWAVVWGLAGCGGADSPAAGTQVSPRMFERQAALADTALCATRAAGATSAVAYQEVDGECMSVFTGGESSPLVSAKAARPLARAIKPVDASAFMNWAQQVFAPFFPSGPATVTVPGLAYRYYPGTQNYIAVLDDTSIAILGPVSGNQLAFVGKLADFSCAVYPENCQAQVDGITSVNALSYSQGATLVVNGSALDQGISLTAPGCGTVAELAGGSATQRRYSCAAVASATQLAVTVKNAAGTTLSTTNLAVPDPQVTMVTNFGTMVVELYPAKAPITVNNFLKYTHDGFYTNTTFHRVISNFVIQGGGFLSNMAQKATTYPAIKLESNNGLSNVRGTIAMARGAAADTATSQFYFNVVDNSSCLDYGKVTCDTTGNGYAVFGQIVSGLSVADTIKVQPTFTVQANGTTYSDVPVANGIVSVLIQSVAQTR